ncbi:NlpC/P60 family protein [Actinoplanes sp. KI2]|uniref:C40 family peptidase n=1 Tax=Actinoplanes sp. KI2 TaxID=2983315 RepID=UPI0021D60DA0|nr:NlpC/P60 family protein [Actinoplanes sp. KI2]MCU7723560.1 NlpC/P60 family protein [Actinoplanes sp. KI2]
MSRRRRLSVGTGTAALSLGLCLCAGQLISTPAASAAAPVLTAAQASAKVNPLVRTSVSARTINKGQLVRVTAKYFNPKTHKAVSYGWVRLQAFRGGKWVTQSAGKVNTAGSVNLYMRPASTVSLRAVYLANAGYNQGTGGSIRITVRNRGAAVLAEAKRHTGALYKFGAAGPTRFDCSGFTEYVFKKAAGKNLPHKANSQQHYGTAVSKSAAQVGDLIIFRSGSYGYHAGIYAGGGYMYDSPHTGARVGKHKMYGSNYVVRRLV